jgi:hypothetical protein
MTPYWVEIGRTAEGLAVEGSIVVLLYWVPAGVAELDGPGGDPVVMDAGFYWLAVDGPVDHLPLFECGEPTNADWELAREQAARAVLA